MTPLAISNVSSGAIRIIAAGFLLTGSISGPVAGQSDTAAPSRAPDVHFVPTDTAIVRAMLDAARVGKRDVVYDLGCGDGRIVITAVKQHGARGVCVDIDPVRISESRQNADTAGVARRINFRQADLFETDLRPATVVTLYLLPQLNERLRPKLFRELRPGSRVVSNAFDMGEWKADRVLTVATSGFNSYAYYWLMPADVAGTWQIDISSQRPATQSQDHGYELRLEQRFQHLTGARATSDGQPVEVSAVSLSGDSLSFTLQNPREQGGPALRFSGKVKGDRIEGKLRQGQGKARSWSAERTERGARPELEMSAAAGG